MVKEKTKTGQETVTVTPNSYDVGSARLPEQTITLEEYRRLGGTPVRQQLPEGEYASIDTKIASHGRSSTTERNARIGGSRVQTHQVAS